MRQASFQFVHDALEELRSSLTICHKRRRRDAFCHVTGEHRTRAGGYHVRHRRQRIVRHHLAITLGPPVVGTGPADSFGEEPQPGIDLAFSERLPCGRKSNVPFLQDFRAAGCSGEQACSWGFIDNQRLYHLRMIEGKEQRGMCAGRVSNYVSSLHAEPCQDGGQIFTVNVCRRIRQTIPTRYVRKMVLPAIGDGTVAFREHRKMRIPKTIILKSTVHQNNGIALASLDIGKLRAVDAYLFDVSSDSCGQMPGTKNEAGYQGSDLRSAWW